MEHLLALLGRHAHVKLSVPFDGLDDSLQKLIQLLNVGKRIVDDRDRFLQLGRQLDDGRQDHQRLVARFQGGG